MRPISASGWRTVVSDGETIADCSESSKPTTERSSGTRRPRSRATRSAPIAVLSLNAKIAVGGSAWSSSRDAAMAPPSMPKLDSRISAGSGSTPAPDIAPWKPFSRSLDREVLLGAGDRADPAMAEREQVLGRSRAPEAFAAETAGMPSSSATRGSTITNA